MEDDSIRLLANLLINGNPRNKIGGGWMKSRKKLEKELRMKEGRVSEWERYGTLPNQYDYWEHIEE